jgi:hypothetical protein
VDEPLLSPDEVEQAVRACAWVRVTAPFYPLLQPFLQARLAASPLLATKLGRPSGEATRQAQAPAWPVYITGGGPAGGTVHRGRPA